MPVYLVSVVELTNPGPNMKRYAERSAELIRQHGGRYLVRGKASQVVSGELFNNRVLIVTEFPALENYQAFRNSDAYQKECRPLREGTGIYDTGVFDAPPPGMA
ncbi:MAG TPA: DUF1330 domain-containing protein [Steroidobacteraceae bacterium]|jgi:uncharacterized protein (DUF1330 family)|nr:DUF1330 domain-containing protein [Steroidobacteraceae bacterium]HNS26902.1 DUF1330 domain-containing protein [Steroidobacteraceae bacterium]